MTTDGNKAITYELRLDHYTQKTKTKKKTAQTNTHTQERIPTHRIGVEKQQRNRIEKFTVFMRDCSA